MKDFSALRHCQAKKVKVMNSGKLRHGSEVTFLENVGGGGGWCTFLGFGHNDINSW